MRSIAVINQKGGVGKTTVAINLAYGLALSGRLTLLVDLDPQAHSTAIFGSPRMEGTVNDVILNNTFKVENTIHVATVTGQPVKGLFLMPSNIRLAVAAEQISSRVHREKVLYRALQKMSGKFEMVVIDCPPTLGVLAVNGIYAADEFMIPTTYSRYALDGIADLFTIIREVKEVDSFIYKILRNGYDSRTTQTNKFIEGELDTVRENIAKTVIRKSETINQAAINGVPIFIFDPKGHGTEDFSLFTKEVLNG